MFTRYKGSVELPDWGRSGVLSSRNCRSYKAGGSGHGVGLCPVLGLPSRHKGDRFKTKISLALPQASRNIPSFTTHKDQTWPFTPPRSSLLTVLRSQCFILARQSLLGLRFAERGNLPIHPLVSSILRFV